MLSSENCTRSPCCSNTEASALKLVDSIKLDPCEPKKVKLVTDLISASDWLSTTTSAEKVLEFPEPYWQPIDFTFCGVYVVTVFLNRTGTTAAAALGFAAPSGFCTVTAGGWAYSTFTAFLLIIIAL